jgi:hypothetical protein
MAMSQVLALVKKDAASDIDHEWKRMVQPQLRKEFSLTPTLSLKR